MSILVFPFVGVLMLLALYLIPVERRSTGNAVSGHCICNRKRSVDDTVAGNSGNGVLSLKLTLRSSLLFAVAKREEYGDMAEQKCLKILAFAHIMMVLTVMFFVFSCVLSLTPADLAAAKEQNISILSYLANHFNAPIIAWMAPIIAIIAITKSFLGHYLGAREGFNGMVD